jgi:hypothetical protein
MKRVDWASTSMDIAVTAVIIYPYVVKPLLVNGISFFIAITIV